MINKRADDWSTPSRRENLSFTKVTPQFSGQGRYFLRDMKITRVITAQSIVTNWNKSGNVTIRISPFRLILQRLAYYPISSLIKHIILSKSILIHGQSAESLLGAQVQKMSVKAVQGVSGACVAVLQVTSKLKSILSFHLLSLQVNLI